MPREDIEIALSESDPYWSGALFMAVLAYPDPDERTQRDKFHHTLIRWALHRLMEKPEWSQELQLLRPVYFCGADSLHDKILAHGNKRLQRRSVIAQHVVLPHLRKFDTGRVHTVEGFLPTFDRMITQATAKLGLEVGSSSTVAARDWSPLKPVAHAMCAYFVWSEILWTMWGRNADVDRRLAFLILPEYVEEVAQLAEHFRPQVCSISEFKICDEQTIRIATRWLEDSDAVES
jgi:hypothetical protein